jgi:hypothetical protein
MAHHIANALCRSIEFVITAGLLLFSLWLTCYGALWTAALD